MNDLSAADKNTRKTRDNIFQYDSVTLPEWNVLESSTFKYGPTAVSFKLFKGPARQGDESEVFFWNTSQTNFSTKASG